MNTLATRVLGKPNSFRRGFGIILLSLPARVDQLKRALRIDELVVIKHGLGVTGDSTGLTSIPLVVVN